MAGECGRDEGVDGRVQLVGAEAGNAGLAVLPHDAAGGGDDDHPVVRTAIDRIGAARQGRAGRRDAGSRDQREGTESLGVVRSDDAVGAGFVRAVPELPHDGVRVRIDLDDAVVELIRDDDVAPVVEIRRCRSGRTEQSGQERTHQDPAAQAPHQYVAHDCHLPN